MKGQKRNFQNAQPQAIASALYQMKHVTKWLMTFDTDEYALPGQGEIIIISLHTYLLSVTSAFLSILSI